MRTDDPTAAIARIFADPTAAFTIDEIAARFDMTLGEVIRALRPRRPPDRRQCVPGSTQVVAS